MIITNNNSKVNFTDENDVYVGYDTDQDCYEHAGYFITSVEDSVYTFDMEFPERDTTGYLFDTDYLVDDITVSELELGGQVRFKLTHHTKEPIYLNLFNSHNGYYGHEFIAKIKDQKWKEGVL